jgi:hypothetical protein
MTKKTRMQKAEALDNLIKAIREGLVTSWEATQIFIHILFKR